MTDAAVKVCFLVKKKKKTNKQTLLSFQSKAEYNQQGIENEIEKKIIAITTIKKIKDKQNQHKITDKESKLTLMPYRLETLRQYKKLFFKLNRNHEHPNTKKCQRSSKETTTQKLKDLPICQNQQP